MKKLSKLLMMLGLASLVTFSSCSKDDDDDTNTAADATVTITARRVVGSTATVMTNGGTINRGDSVNVEVSFVGNDKNMLKSYVITGSWKAEPLEQGTLTGTTATITTGGIIDTSFSVGNHSFTVSLTSDKGVKTASFQFVVEQGTVIGQNSINFDLGNQADALAKFWSGKRSTTTTAAVYFLADVVGEEGKQADIDFGYASRSAANGGNMLVSPNSNDATAIYADQWSNTAEKITNWTKRNNTYFRLTTLTANDFNAALTPEEITALITSAKGQGEPNLQSISVQDGKVYLYKTEKGLYGVIYVAAASGSVNAGGTAQPGTVSVIAKYEQEQ